MASCHQCAGHWALCQVSAPQHRGRQWGPTAWSAVFHTGIYTTCKQDFLESHRSVYVVIFWTLIGQEQYRISERTLALRPTVMNLDPDWYCAQKIAKLLPYWKLADVTDYGILWPRGIIWLILSCDWAIRVRAMMEMGFDPPTDLTLLDQPWYRDVIWSEILSWSAHMITQYIWSCLHLWVLLDVCSSKRLLARAIRNFMAWNGSWWILIMAMTRYLAGMCGRTIFAGLSCWICCLPAKCDGILKRFLAASKEDNMNSCWRLSPDSVVLSLALSP